MPSLPNGKYQNRALFSLREDRETRKSWGTTETDLQNDDACVLLRATNFLEAVSRRIQPRWKDSDEFKINRTTQISPYKPLTNNIHKKKQQTKYRTKFTLNKTEHSKTSITMVRGAINTALGLTKVGVVVRTMGGGEKVPRTELNFI